MREREENIVTERRHTETKTHCPLLLFSATARLQKESDAKRSSMESCEKYEKKLRKVELKAKENLQKEGKRRQEAEYLASKLKKKVSELTFLLNEKADESDDDASSADSSRAASPAPGASSSSPSDHLPPDSPTPSRKVMLVPEEEESVVKIEKLPA